MPQISHAYAVARVRTAQKALLSRAALERLMACESGGVLLRALNELGWGEAGDVDALAQRALNEACAFVRAVTPDANATDCFLAKYDVLNLKTLVKARALRMEDVPLSPNGTLSVQVLRTALEGEKYEALPEAYRAALEEIARECALAMDPLLCDALLDRALFREIARRLTSVREKEIHACFAARADSANVRSALRARGLGRDAAFASRLFVPGGLLPPSELATLVETPERAKALVKDMPYAPFALRGLAIYEKGGSLAAFEKQMDDYETSLMRAHRYEPVSLLPLVGYFVAREHDVATVRLIAAAVSARFAPERYADFVREPYVLRG